MGGGGAAPAEEAPPPSPRTAAERERYSQERMLLETEVRELRTELRNADVGLQAVTDQAMAASSAARMCREQHRQWTKKVEAEAARLQKENKRLERSAQQASAEERRLADALRVAPERAEATLS